MFKGKIKAGFKLVKDKIENLDQAGGVFIKIGKLLDAKKYDESLELFVNNYELLDNGDMMNDKIFVKYQSLESAQRDDKYKNMPSIVEEFFFGDFRTKFSNSSKKFIVCIQGYILENLYCKEIEKSTFNSLLFVLSLIEHHCYGEKYIVEIKNKESEKIVQFLHSNIHNVAMISFFQQVYQKNGQKSRIYSMFQDVINVSTFSVFEEIQLPFVQTLIDEKRKIGNEIKAENDLLVKYEAEINSLFSYFEEEASLIVKNKDIEKLKELYNAFNPRDITVKVCEIIGVEKLKDGPIKNRISKECNSGNTYEFKILDFAISSTYSPDMLLAANIDYEYFFKIIYDSKTLNLELFDSFFGFLFDSNKGISSEVIADFYKPKDKKKSHSAKGTYAPTNPLDTSTPNSSDSELLVELIKLFKIDMLINTGGSTRASFDTFFSKHKTNIEEAKVLYKISERPIDFPSYRELSIRYSINRNSNFGEIKNNPILSFHIQCLRRYHFFDFMLEKEKYSKIYWTIFKYEEADADRLNFKHKCGYLLERYLSDLRGNTVQYNFLPLKKNCQDRIEKLLNSEDYRLNEEKYKVWNEKILNEGKLLVDRLSAMDIKKHLDTDAFVKEYAKRYRYNAKLRHELEPGYRAKIGEILKSLCLNLGESDNWVSKEVVDVCIDYFESISQGNECDKDCIHKDLWNFCFDFTKRNLLDYPRKDYKAWKERILNEGKLLIEKLSVVDIKKSLDIITIEKEYAQQYRKDSEELFGLNQAYIDKEVEIIKSLSIDYAESENCISKEVIDICIKYIKSMSSQNERDKNCFHKDLWEICFDFVNKGQLFDYPSKDSQLLHIENKVDNMHVRDGQIYYTHNVVPFTAPHISYDYLIGDKPFTPEEIINEKSLFYKREIKYGERKFDVQYELNVFSFFYFDSEVNNAASVIESLVFRLYYGLGPANTDLVVFDPSAEFKNLPKIGSEINYFDEVDEFFEMLNDLDKTINKEFRKNAKSGGISKKRIVLIGDKLNQYFDTGIESEKYWKTIDRLVTKNIDGLYFLTSKILGN